MLKKYNIWLVLVCALLITNFFVTCARGADNKTPCIDPAKGPVTNTEVKQDMQIPKQDVQVTAKVGKPAPDFEASAYVKGEFKNIKLSDYKGKWVVLCFYPGDFTFV